MWVYANDSRIRYCGRIDWNEKGEPTWVYPCTSAEFIFTGRVLRIHVKNYNEYWENYLGCILDDVQSCYYLENDEETVIEIRVPKNAFNVHHVLFFKRQDACHEMTILGYEIGDGEKLLSLPAAGNRRIEIYGDSVSAGEVSEAIDFVGKKDPNHNGGYSNSWYSYGWIAARMLGAQIHDIAQGGIALMDKTGWFQEPEQVGMETAWNKVNYDLFHGAQTEWDFTKYQPQVVIVAIGQNDNHPVDFMTENYAGEKSVLWRRKYKLLLENLRKVYPEAYIICCTTLLEHEPSWDRAIGEVVEMMEDGKISQCLFRRNGVGTPGHQRIPEAYEMAKELVDYIDSLDIKAEGWNEEEK